MKCSEPKKLCTRVLVTVGSHAIHDKVYFTDGTQCMSDLLGSLFAPDAAVVELLHTSRYLPFFFLEHHFPVLFPSTDRDPLRWLDSIRVMA